MESESFNNPFQGLHLADSVKKNITCEKHGIDFSDENIQKLFGHEAAEDETITNLKKYYFRTDIYEQVSANLKLRILVGFKGVGKSALFKVLVEEDRKKNILPIEIKPDDVLGICNTSQEFLSMIREWKEGIKKIIVTKVTETFIQDANDDITSMIGQKINKIIPCIFSLMKDKISDAKVDKALFDNFEKNKKINIYIDDLDRGWKGTEIDISRLSALLNAIRDISNENEQINFKVSLRSDVYYLVRTSDESTDKIEGSVVWFSWTNHQILALLVKRILSYWGTSVTDEDLLKKTQEQLATYIDSVMTDKFEGVGKWHNIPIHRVLMSLVRKRPRDIVKLCTLAAKNARKYNRKKIDTEDFQSIFDRYSLDRLQDTINEFRSELPDIEKLLFLLKPSSKRSNKYNQSYIYTTEDIINKLELGIAKNNFQFSNSHGKETTATELVQFLYKIGFITARKTDRAGKIVRKTFEENKYLSSPDLNFSFSWEVHPAYRWALEPDDFNAIYEKLDIATDWE